MSVCDTGSCIDLLWGSIVKTHTKFNIGMLVFVSIIIAFFASIVIDPGSKYVVMKIEQGNEAHYEVAHCHFLLGCTRWGYRWKANDQGLADARQTVAEITAQQNKPKEKITVIQEDQK
jgi:hypothetical protein